MSDQPYTWAEEPTKSRASNKYAWFYESKPGDTHTFIRHPEMDRHTLRTRIAAARHYAQLVTKAKFSMRMTPDGSVQCRHLMPGEKPAMGRPPLDAAVKKATLSRAQRLEAFIAERRKLFELALGTKGFDLSAPSTPEIDEIRQRARFQLRNSAAVLADAFKELFPAWATGNYIFRAKALAANAWNDIHPNPHTAILALERTTQSLLKMDDGEHVPVKAHWVTKMRFGRPHDTAVIAIGVVPPDVDLRELV